MIPVSKKHYLLYLLFLSSHSVFSDENIVKNETSDCNTMCIAALIKVEKFCWYESKAYSEGATVCMANPNHPNLDMHEMQPSSVFVCRKYVDEDNALTKFRWLDILTKHKCP
jgi:hypothetical protein